MAPAAEDLWLVRLEVGWRPLHELARRMRLPPRTVDVGYLMHCLLADLFDQQAPRPFAVMEDLGRSVGVLGYARCAAEELARAAHERGSPPALTAVNWPALESKVMPRDWQSGKLFRYWTRVCPTVRKAQSGTHNRKGAEVDAFVSACWAAGAPEVPVSRESVYREWLQAHLERQTGARLRDSRLERFERSRLVRRGVGHPRRAHVTERPMAELSGTIEVTDGAAFRCLLQRGLGRHRAFGFGLLLLRPVAS